MFVRAEPMERFVCFPEYSVLDIRTFEPLRVLSLACFCPCSCSNFLEQKHEQEQAKEFLKTRYF